MQPSHRLGALEHHAESLCRIAAYTASVLVAATIVYHLALGSTAFLGLLEDDYYYYAIVADNFLTLGKLTYDGVTLTNGFHPLWFVLILLLRFVFGGFGTPFYIALTLVFLGSMIATYELGRRFARQLGAPPRFAAAIAALYSLAAAVLLADGMECALALPLLLWLLIESAKATPMTPRRAAKLGFISSLAVLARLDIALLVGLLIIGYAVFARPRIAESGRAIVAFCVGGALVPIYAAANLVMLGSMLPVSAQAKRLTVQHGFSLAYARGIAFGTVYGRTVGVVLPLGVGALLLLIRREPRQQVAARLTGGAALVFAFLFYGLNALTGWIYFGWYAYPLTPALVAALVFIGERWPLASWPATRTIAFAVLVALAPAFAVQYFLEHGPKWSITDNALLSMSYDLRNHLQGRDGLFAMGAIAGVATYVLDKPVLQLEGIVSDRAMVQHVADQDPLGDVLREYHADYLIVSLANVRSEPHDGCYLVTQPHAEWAGKRTAKMRGEICAEPIEHFFTEQGHNAWSIFPTIETLVWDLRGARWKTAGEAEAR